MLGHFDELLVSTANDGASAPIAVCSIGHADDVDQLMDAWYRERQGRIEAGLFLDEARQLLRRIISEGEITPANRRKARRLLLAIEASKREDRGERS